MPDADGPDDPDFEDASVQLNEGLKNCRAVVSGYRTLLSGDGGEEAGTPLLSQPDPANDEAAG